MTTNQFCGRCRQPLFRDESLQTVQYPSDRGTVTVACCPRCEASVRGCQPPLRAVYPAGFTYNFGVCGVCRRAMGSDEEGTPMRLAAEDIAGAGLEIKEGCYQSCKECVELFRPFIAMRLGMTVQMVRGGWLL